jgi:hypothetical protein
MITKNYMTQNIGLWTHIFNNFMLLSVNVIERNGSDCKYVEIFTHRVGSIGAPSRKTLFIRGTNTKQWEVPKIAGRNRKANIFQKGCAGFKATIIIQIIIMIIIIIIIIITTPCNIFTIVSSNQWPREPIIWPSAPRIQHASTWAKFNVFLWGGGGYRSALPKHHINKTRFVGLDVQE